MCLGKNSNDDDTFTFNVFNLKNNSKVTIPGRKIYQTFTFNSHIKTLCTKGGQKDTKLS